MSTTQFATISRDITGKEDLVVLPRKELERILVQMDILRIAQEAKKLKRAKRLPVLISLKDLRMA